MNCLAISLKCFILALVFISPSKSENNDAFHISEGSKISLEVFQNLNKNFVATTPSIILAPKQLTRYERGLEDYEEAINNVEQNSDKQTSQFSDGSNTMQQILNVLSTLFSQSLKTARKVNQLSQTGTINKNGPKNNQSSDNNEAETVKNAEDVSIDNGTISTVSEPRYIKGDPLNGYYDFIVTEGSYKFWVVFQLATAALLIYSTMAAIYYSKVNPLTSDYDYADYVGRSFQGRSLISDDDSVEDTLSYPARSYFSSLKDNTLFNVASTGFQIAMNAIEKVPQ